jgi:hypothetical protein
MATPINPAFQRRINPRPTSKATKAQVNTALSSIGIYNNSVFIYVMALTPPGRNRGRVIQGMAQGCQLD